MVTFGVVIPVYNCEKYLERCVSSILAQTYQNFEIVLVDDGSKDGSPAQCVAMAARDPRIQVICHKENLGASNARKTGVNAVSGEYIVCIDADDWVENTYLEQFHKVLEDHAPDIICCEYYKTDGVSNTRKHIRYEEGLYLRADIESKIFPGLIEDVNGRYFPSSLCMKAIRKDLFAAQQNAVDEKIRIGEDGAVCKPCLYNANSIFVLKEPLYYYYNNMASTTRCRQAFNWDDPRLRGKHLEKQIPMNVADFQDQVYRIVVHSLFNVAESQFNRQEKYRVIAKEIKAVLKDPYYQKAIKHCKFQDKKGKLALFALKYKQIRIIKFFNRLKYR